MLNGMVLLMSCSSLLKLYCAVPFRAVILTVVDCDDRTQILREEIPANTTVAIPLPAKRLRVQVRSADGSHGGLTKWIDLSNRNTAGLYLSFGGTVRYVPRVRLDIRIEDVHYPNSIPINGGLTVCRIPLKPSTL